MRKIILIAIFCFSNVLVAQKTTSQKKRDVVGTITDSNGNPIANVKVKMTFPVGSSTLSIEDGVFHFLVPNNIKRCNLSLTHPYYETEKNYPVSIDDDDNGKSSIVPIQLEYKAGRRYFISIKISDSLDTSLKIGDAKIKSDIDILNDKTVTGDDYTDFILPENITTGEVIKIIINKNGYEEFNKDFKFKRPLYINAKLINTNQSIINTAAKLEGRVKPPISQGSDSIETHTTVDYDEVKKLHRFFYNLVSIEYNSIGNTDMNAQVLQDIKSITGGKNALCQFLYLEAKIIFYKNLIEKYNLNKDSKLNDFKTVDSYYDIVIQSYKSLLNNAFSKKEAAYCTNKNTEKNESENLQNQLKQIIKITKK